MIRLKPFTTEDIPELLEWLESTDTRFLHQFAGLAYTYPLDSVQLKASLETPDSLLFRAVELPMGRTIGHGQILRIDKTSRMASIGRILIKQEERGKGLGGLIIKELIQYARNELHLVQLSLNVFDFNQAAVKCYTNAGFKTMEMTEKYVEPLGETWKIITMEYNQG